MVLGEWLGIAGLVVAIMALPSVFQMLWGRPQINFELASRMENGASVLCCKLFNQPIKNRILIWMGVKRESANIYGAYKIWNVEAGRFVFTDVIQPLLVTQEDNAIHLELRPGVLGAAFAVICVAEGNAYVVQNEKQIKNPEIEKGTVLSPGNYRVPIIIFCGEAKFIKSAEFVITADPMNSYWIGD
ncbi:MAG TPA: hypothetical protein VGN52_23440 [Burkholderiales bacterium]|jgi:hypothetical protein